MTTNVPSSIALDDPSLYFNRELSWLEFNRRVLEEAQDPSVPLLERLKFLAIFESNLDEFYMVRVGGVQRKVELGIAYGSGADRMPATELLDRINQKVTQLTSDAYRCLFEHVLPGLEHEGIVIRQARDLTEADKKHLAEFFRNQVSPVLTPLAIDPGHPFPQLLNKSLNLAVMLKRPDDPEQLFAVVQVPSVLARFVPLPVDPGSLGHRQVFTSLETVIRLHLPTLFPGMRLNSDAVFRVSRDSDIEIDDDDFVEDLRKAIEEGVRKRRRGAAVRLQIEVGAHGDLEAFLFTKLDLDPTDVYRVPSLLDLTGLFPIASLPSHPHLRDPQFTPQPVPVFQEAPTIWTAIRARDILVHHPYETFGCVVDFIEEAANDERVLAIKQTLYRTSADSPIVRALQRAADNGKQVTALVEIKARLDEERNIIWARELEKAGVHVVFGFVGLKTHCKVALVVRREEDGSIRRYVHLATGNYNPTTARIYTDLGYFTCNTDYAEDASALFNYLTGYCELPQWRKLAVAPSRLMSFTIEKINQEAAHGSRGRIIAKVNGILEPAIIQPLYRASQAGVKIELICRGICALRPGVPGVSDNIRVVSIVDRFLEHSRIFYFENGGNPEVYIGSADWMDRNLIRRVEIVFPIEVPELKKRLIEEILNLSLRDNVKARQLLPDGSYRRLQPESGHPRLRSQERFLELASQNALRYSNLTALAEADQRPIPVGTRRTPRKRQTS